MIHIRKGIKKILKSGFYRVRIRIPGPESGKFETNFFLKCIVTNIFPETKFALKRFLLQAAFINQAPSLGLNYAYLMVLDGSTFSSKILRGVDWSFLFLNFRCICLLSIFRVSETAQCVVLCRTQIFRVSSEYERRFLSIFEHEHHQALDIRTSNGTNIKVVVLL